MFEFMHKFRVPILAAVFIGLIGFGIWGTLELLFGRPSAKNETVAAFAMPGLEEKVEIDSQEVYSTLRFFGSDWKMTALRRFQIQEENPEVAAYDFLVLAKAAEAAGLTPPPAELKRLYLENGMKEQFNRMSDEALEFERRAWGVQRLRGAYSQDPGGASYDDIYDDFKREFAELSGRYVLIEAKSPESFEIDVTTEEGRGKLEEHLKLRPALKAQHRKQESVDLEVVYMATKGKSVAEVLEAYRVGGFAESTATETVTEADLRARYDADPQAYGQLAARERASETAPEGEQPTAFEFLKANGHLEREIRVARALAALTTEISDNPAGAEALAKSKGFRFAKLDAISQEDLAQQPDFGSFRLSQAVWSDGVARLPAEGAEPKEGDYPLGNLLTDSSQTAAGFQNGIFDEPGNGMAVLRMTAHREARDPELTEILSEVREDWQKAESQKDLSDRTNGFREAMEEWILARPELAEKLVEARKKRDEDVSAELTRAQLDRANPEHATRIEGVEKRQEQLMRGRLSPDMKSFYSDAFVEVAKAKELEIRTFGPVTRYTSSDVRLSSDLTRQERLNRLFRSVNTVAAVGVLEPGQFSSRPEPEAGFAVGFLLDQKKEPAKEDMLKHPDWVASTRARRRTAPDYFWSYKMLKTDAFFGCESPRMEQIFADLAQQEKERQEIQRDAAERARQRIEALKRAQGAPTPPPNPAPVPPTEDAPGDQTPATPPPGGGGD